MTPGAGSRPYDAMPTRTRSSRLLGRRIAAAELARWRHLRARGRRSAARSSASWNAASWASLAGSSGSSLLEKCDQMPVTRIRPVALALVGALREQVGPSCSSGAPPRLSPVSTLSWTRAASPVAATASSSADGVGRHVDVLLDRRAPSRRRGR